MKPRKPIKLGQLAAEAEAMTSALEQGVWTEVFTADEKRGMLKQGIDGSGTTAKPTN